MPRSLRVAPQSIQEVKLALSQNGFLRQQDLAEDVNLSRDTISRFLNGKPVDALNFVKICQVLDINWQEIADLGNRENSFSQAPPDIKPKAAIAESLRPSGEVAPPSPYSDKRSQVFAEAAQHWDLERLYADLGKAKTIYTRKEQGLSTKEKLHLRGLLCGYSPNEIAEKLYKQPTGVEVSLSRTLYRYVAILTERYRLDNWRDVVDWLEEAGYRLYTPGHFQKFPKNLTEPDKKFGEAARDWDLEKLYADLSKAKKTWDPHKKRGLTLIEKEYLRGLLCGYSPDEIAAKLCKSLAGVRSALANTIYRYVEVLTERPTNSLSNWRDVIDWLEEEYRIGLQVRPEFSLENSVSKQDRYFGERKGETLSQSQDNIEAVAEELPPVEERTLAIKSEPEKLYDALIRLDYVKQVTMFRRFLEKSAVGALLIHGAPESGQSWLLNRLVQLVPNSPAAKVVPFNYRRKIHPNALWRELGGRVGLQSVHSPLEIAKAVHKLWQSQPVILIFHNLDDMPEKYLSEFIADFWQPLTSMANRLPPSSHHYKLLMFLVDYSGSVDRWNVGFAESLSEGWEPHTPLKLPKINRLSDRDLTAWIENAVNELPLQLTSNIDLTVRRILENSDNGLPQLAIEYICSLCHCNWYEWERIWLKY